MMNSATRKRGTSWRRSPLALVGLVILALVVAISGCSVVAPGGTAGPSITIALGQEPGMLDEQIDASTTNNYAIGYNVSESFVRMMPDGTLKGILAESWQDVDASTIRFKLRQNAKFSDGTPFDAEAAKVSMEAHGVLEDKGMQVNIYQSLSDDQLLEIRAGRARPEDFIQGEAA